jgi:hypothetical protein
MRQRSNAWWCLAVLGLVVALGHGTAALAADATGTWTWTVERGGNTIEQTLKLKQDKDQLTGAMVRQGTETPIEDGKVSGETITFKVTREFGGNKVVFKYEGKVAGDVIKGETKFEREGETQSRPWEAKRAK